MDQKEFCTWLVEQKGFTVKTAHDVACRVRRLLSITGETEFTKDTLAKAEKDKAFPTFTMCVKSQLRRAAHLVCEYKGI